LVPDRARSVAEGLNTQAIAGRAHVADSGGDIGGRRGVAEPWGLPESDGDHDEPARCEAPVIVLAPRASPVDQAPGCTSTTTDELTAGSGGRYTRARSSSPSGSAYGTSSNEMAPGITTTASAGLHSVRTGRRPGPPPPGRPVNPQRRQGWPCELRRLDLSGRQSLPTQGGRARRSRRQAWRTR